MDDVRAISLFGKKSYSDVFPNIPPLDEKDFFVLFDYLTLHLHIAGNWQKDRELNLFEESILRFLGIGNYTQDALSENLCLPKDLVGLILASLESKEYIANSKTITEKGSNYISGTPTSNATDLTPVYVLIRRDSGEILPMLFPRKALAKTATLERDTKRVSVTIGSAGKEETFNCRYIISKSSYQRKTLTQNEIRSLIKRYNNSSEQRISIPKDTHIEYSFEGQIFVHTKFILQEGYVENVLSSLGNSYHSPWVLEYARKIYPNLCSKMKQEAVSHLKSDGNKKRKNISGRYNKLRKYLNVTANTREYENLDELNENRADDAQTVRNLSTAVEWALSYHIREIGIPETLVFTLSAQTPVQNGTMLFSMAEGVGLPHINKYRCLFSSVSYTNFSAWQAGSEPSLTLLLPIAIGIARRRSDSRLIAAILALGKYETMGDGLAIIERLNRYGKAVRHGEKWLPTNGDTIDGLKKAVLIFVDALLPEYRDTGQEEKVQGWFGSASQRKLNAEVKVLKALGDFVFYGLPDDIRRLLLESVRLAETCDAVATITTLSSILEKEFLNKFNPQKGDSDLKRVRDRLCQRNALPQGLERVSPTYYKNALCGEKSTLGASFLSWAGSLTDDELDAAIKVNMSSLVNNLAGMRGHGAGSLELDMEDVLRTQEDVFAALIWLEEN